MRLSFKKMAKEGRYRSFQKDYTEIKADGKYCGFISEVGHEQYRVGFKILKKDILEDNNPNCVWRIFKCKSVYKNEDAARDWIKHNWKAISEKRGLGYELYIDRDE